MPLKVTVDLAAYPKGQPLGFAGLGIIKNGETLEISEEMEREFFAEHGEVIANAFKNQEGVNISGSAELAPPKETEPVRSEQVVVEAPTPTDEGSES